MGVTRKLCLTVVLIISPSLECVVLTKALSVSDVTRVLLRHKDCWGELNSFLLESQSCDVADYQQIPVSLAAWLEFSAWQDQDCVW